MPASHVAMAAERGRRLATIATAPLIYSLLIPFVLLDLWVTLYQQLCFRAYGIARVPRRAYMAIDRHKLAYLDTIGKLNCTYCGYSNGVIAYAREVASRTEQYWCPIKHRLAIPEPHQRYRRFAAYGDEQDYNLRRGPLREELRQAGSAASADRTAGTSTGASGRTP